MAFPNEYTHRKVAETAAKSCEICYKPSSSVLITPDSKDWFYVCPSHLGDAGFCAPKIDHAAIEARKKKELEAEIERVKKEYEERQQKKKEKAEKKDDKDGKDKDKEKKDEKEDDKEKTAAAVRSKKEDTPVSPTEDEEPRVFELKPTFFQQRLFKKRQAEIAKRNRERLRDPNYFPSVPKNLP
ncbi:VPS4-associated protein 1 [Triangularia verruculosa]|uniref:VPS4-associated protein 1 n=1 Tax=Triangularia verruculosa TaxID=2587418 RepID=A0AAN6X9K6_9PEZI|nr:VPS4-associated protein 1 [Triangularia verruculosa]